jgi:hypothetical protein
MSLQTTSSQTVGPYLHIGLTWLVTDNLVGPGVSGEKVTIEGRIRTATARRSPCARRDLASQRAWKVCAPG